MVDYQLVFGGVILFALLILAFVFTVLQLKKKEKEKAKKHVVAAVGEQKPVAKPLVVEKPVQQPSVVEDPQVVKLRAYISAQVAAGVSQEDITAALLGKGWQLDLIDKAFKGL